MAIRQFETCAEVLSRELGIPPMEETRALCQHILADGGARGGGEIATSTFENVIKRFNFALSDFDHARERLARAARLFERLWNDPRP